MARGSFPEWLRQNAAALAAFATLFGAGLTDRVLLENRLTRYEHAVERNTEARVENSRAIHEIRSVGARGFRDEAMYLGVERQIDARNEAHVKAIDDRVQAYRREEENFRKRFKQLNPQVVWPEE